MIGIAAPANAALSGVGTPDPGSLFPTHYTDSNGLQLQLCQDGLPNCLAGPEQIQDIHATGGDAEAFYFHASAENVGGFLVEAALEAAYLADGADQEVTFQRRQAGAKGVTPNGKYTITDPFGTYQCTADGTGLVQPAKGCRFETTPIPTNFNAALNGPIGPFVTWDTFGSTGTGAPPAGFIGDNTTPHKVIGSPTGFNKIRVSGPGIVGTCTNDDLSTVGNCKETDLLVVQGKVQPGGATAALSAGTLDFGDVPGTPAVKKTLTYANTGDADITLTSAEVTGTGAAAFGVTNNCPATVTVGTRCTIDVTFTPDPGKASAATLTVTDNTAVGSRTVALKGSNLGVMYVADPAPPAGLVFPTTAVGATSLEDIVVIGNSGSGPLTIAGPPVLGGASAGHYKLGPTNTCTGAGVTVAPDGGCEIGVQFKPTSSGSKSANLKVTDSNGKSVLIPLSATGSADTTAPSAPTLSGSRTDTTANLSWTAATDNIAVTGYQLYRDGTAVGPVSTTRTFSDANLAPGTYNYTVKAVDGANNSSVASNTITITVPAPDTTAPTAPTLSGSVTGTSANLSWTAATDNVGVTGYQVFRGTTQVGTTTAATRTFSQAGLAPGTYAYTVKAVDAVPNTSVASNTVTLTVPAPDTTAPTAPTLSGSVTGTSANLSWTAATDNVGVTGYQVFRGTTQVGTTTAATRTFSQAGLAPGTYAYTVKAVDAVPNTSVASNTVTLTVASTNPAPTVTGRAPAVNATSVGVAANVTATFSEAVTGVGTGTFQLKNPAGTVIGASVTASTTVANQWILNPTANLANDTKYTVTLTGGAAAIRDTAGAPLTTVTWSFTTGPAPTVTARTPGVGVTGVSRAANITATFSEAVAGVSTSTFIIRPASAPTSTPIVGTVTRNGTTNQWILNPGANLAANTQYTVTLDGGPALIRDNASNPLVDVTWNFTTGAA